MLTRLCSIVLVNIQMQAHLYSRATIDRVPVYPVNDQNSDILGYTKDEQVIYTNVGSQVFRIIASESLIVVDACTTFKMYSMYSWLFCKEIVQLNKLLNHNYYCLKIQLRDSSWKLYLLKWGYIFYTMKCIPIYIIYESNCTWILLVGIHIYINKYIP